MKSKGEQLPVPADSLSQLKEKNHALAEENIFLRSALEKQATIEQKYKESQERFRTIFEKSHFGNKIIDSTLTIIQVNQNLQQLLGYSAQELLGTQIIAYVHPDFVQPWHDLQENLWAKDIPFFQMETCLIRKDGSPMWCQVTSILFRDNKATLGYTTLEDISMRKDLEEMLAKQTELINRDLDNFIYIASHDLKAPVVNIEGLLLALNQQLSGSLSLNHEESQLLAMIGEASDKLKATIVDLTGIARVQKEAVEQEIVSIDPLIEEVYEGLNNLIGQTPVKLSKQMEVTEICFVKKYLQTILYNLLSNAIKYRSAERLLEITVNTQRQGNYMVLEVIDNGMGMSDRHLAKLFTMFKRFHTHVEGTGIGLYMVKRMIENAGGKIDVASHLDVGTSVKVYLPYPAK
ncbi:MAG: HAMP domain-containing sensor histidine kinase [Bacteroidota bacterium]